MGNSNNSIRCINTLLHTADARVAEFEMGPETEGEVHYHSVVSEHCICLKGQVRIRIDGSSEHTLEPGSTLEIPAGVTHQVINSDENPCRYLVVQSGGACDFIVV